MNEYLISSVLAARHEDIESWMQMLVFVIVIAGYALSAILKTTKKKAEGQGEQERQPQRPSRLKLQRQGPPTGKPKAKKVVHMQPGVGKVSTKKRQAKQVQIIKPSPEPRPAELTPHIQPQFEELAKPRLGRIEPLEQPTDERPEAEGLSVKAPVDIQEGKYLGEIVSDYADLEQLRRAILHYEILGRPLSLRDPSEHIIGL